MYRKSPIGGSGPGAHLVHAPLFASAQHANLSLDGVQYPTLLIPEGNAPSRLVRLPLDNAALEERIGGCFQSCSTKPTRRRPKTMFQSVRLTA